LLETNYFFKLNDLVEELNLNIPEGADQHVRGAFMCLHRIPVAAMIESIKPTEVQACELSYRIFLAIVT